MRKCISSVGLEAIINQQYHAINLNKTVPLNNIELVSKVSKTTCTPLIHRLPRPVHVLGLISILDVGFPTQEQLYFLVVW